MTFGVSHNGSVDETKVEIPVPCVYVCCAPHQSLSHEVDNMLSSGHRGQESSPRIAVHARPQQLVNLDYHGVQNDELSSQLRHQGGC